MIDLSVDLNLLPAQLGIELGIFFASHAVLSKVLYKPYLEVIRARNAKSTDLKAKSAHQKQEAEKMRLDYETFMKAQRKEVSQWLEEEKKKVADEERSMIEEARNKVAAQLSASRKAVDEELGIARKELLPLVGEYSSKIVTKLTGKKVTLTSPSVTSKKEVEDTV